MNPLRLRLDGLYDIRTLKFALEQGVYEFGIDFVPTSLNFCQLQVLIELINESNDQGKRFFLKFKNDNEWVISKILEDMNKNFPFMHETVYPIEFWDIRGPEFFDNFEHPYYWGYSPEGNFKKVLEGKNLVGIILDYEILDEMYLSGRINSFIQTFYQLTREKSLDVVLKTKWASQYIPSLFDGLEFDSISVPIDESVEICYRNVNLKKIEQNLKYYRSRLPFGPSRGL
jgi:hypothetical protein